MASDTVLVIGGTGNIGSGLVRRLNKSGVPVRVMCRTPESAGDLAAAGVEICGGDLNRPSTLAAVFEGAGTVVIINAMNQDFVHHNFDAVQAAMTGGALRIIRSSALIAEPWENTMLGRMHREADDCVRESGLGFTILKPAFFMQNLELSASAVRREGRLAFPFGGGEVAFFDRRDHVEALAVVVLGGGHAGKTYSLTAQQALDMTRAAELLASELGREVRYDPTTREAAGLGLLRAGLEEWAMRASLEVYINLEGGGGGAVTGDAAYLLGREPGGLAEYFRDSREIFLDPPA